MVTFLSSFVVLTFFFSLSVNKMEFSNERQTAHAGESDSSGTLQLFTNYFIPAPK